jgi:hypothetical protein
VSNSILNLTKQKIDVGSAANLNTTDLFTDEDLIHSSSNNNNNNRNMSTIPPQDILSKASKRKPTQSPPTTTPSYKRIKQITSFKSQTSSSSNNDSIDQLIRWLVNNMFLPEWETRHGNL